MSNFMAVITFTAFLLRSFFSGLPVLSSLSLLSGVRAFPRNMALLSAVVALGSLFLLLIFVYIYLTLGAITSHMTKSATVEALQITALVIVAVVVVVLLSWRPGGFLFGLGAIPGDVAGFTAVVARVVG